jgi:hypothetical protein
VAGYETEQHGNPATRLPSGHGFSGRISTQVFFLKKFPTISAMMHIQQVKESRCFPVGPINIEMDEIRWYKYRCEDCEKVYISTGRQFSICPDCRSDNVVRV